MPDAPSFARAALKAIDRSDLDFIFPLNPSDVTRRRAANYADVPIALSSATTGNDFEWTRNRPEEIHVEFVLHAQDGGRNVDAELQALDTLMDKDTRTGEPLDLVFRFGPRSDRVRITDKEVSEKIWNADLSVRQARVKLTMRTKKPRFRDA